LRQRGALSSGFTVGDMVHAICLKCGTGKVGAMAQCPRCAFLPQKTEDKAKSILLSDRCAKMAVLEKVGQKIARGEKMKFDEADVHKWSDALESAPKPIKKVAGLTTRQWTILGVAIGAGIAFGFCLAGFMLLQ
jgi:hypothetical protein